jgi:hypothetical protein
MKIFAWLGLLVLVATLGAQTPPAPPPEARQFDFWVGDWAVFNPEGEKVGENRIEKMAAGWGLQESWTGADGNSGRSLNTWIPRKKQWQQLWIGVGGALELAGGLNPKGEMVLEGRLAERDGKERINRITWTPNSDGTVRQQWTSSVDRGTTWATVFDGLYRRQR